MRVLFILFVSVWLSGCVTTTDSSFSKKVNELEAHDRYVQLALAYIQRRDYERARLHLGRALKIDAESAAAYSAFGLLYQEEGEFLLAEESFNKALKYDEHYTRGRTYYAAHLFSQEKYHQALDQLLVAAADTEYEGRAQVLVNLALCQIKVGKNTDAIDTYKKVLRLDRYNRNAFINLGQLLISENRYNEAQQYYSKLLSLIRNGITAHSSESLWLGIQLASHYGNNDQEASFVLVLKSMYPDSLEYKKYKALNSDHSK